jgi:hypothetical protein
MGRVSDDGLNTTDARTVCGTRHNIEARADWQTTNRGATGRRPRNDGPTVTIVLQIKRGTFDRSNAPLSLAGCLRPPAGLSFVAYVFYYGPVPTPQIDPQAGVPDPATELSMSQLNTLFAIASGVVMSENAEATVVPSAVAAAAYSGAQTPVKVDRPVQVLSETLPQRQGCGSSKLRAASW